MWLCQHNNLGKILHDKYNMSESYQCREAGCSLVRGRDGEGEKWIALSVQNERERDHSSLVVNAKCGFFTGNRARHVDKENHSHVYTSSEKKFSSIICGLFHYGNLTHSPARAGCWDSMVYTTSALLP